MGSKILSGHIYTIGEDDMRAYLQHLSRFYLLQQQAVSHGPGLVRVKS